MACFAVAVVVALSGCASKVPAVDPVSTVRDPALEKACAEALTVRDLIDEINSGDITPEATTQVAGKVTAFREAANSSKNGDLRAVADDADKRAKTFADPLRSDSERLSAYHPLIRAVQGTFSVCRSVRVSMPGDPPTTAGMDGMGGM